MTHLWPVWRGGILRTSGKIPPTLNKQLLVCPWPLPGMAVWYLKSLQPPAWGWSLTEEVEPKDGKSQIDQPWIMPCLWTSREGSLFLLCNPIRNEVSVNWSWKCPNWFNFISPQIYFSYKYTEPLVPPCREFLVSFKRHHHGILPFPEKSSGVEAAISNQEKGNSIAQLFFNIHALTPE